MPALNRVLLSIVLFVFLVLGTVGAFVGWVFLTYKTPHPCEAIVFIAWEDFRPGTLPDPRTLDQESRKLDTLRCSMALLTGDLDISRLIRDRQPSPAIGADTLEDGTHALEDDSPVR